MSKKKKLEAFECPFKHLTDSEQDMHVVPVQEMWHVHCKVCNAFGPACETPEEAISEWNKRDVMVFGQEDFDKMMGA